LKALHKDDSDSGSHVPSERQHEASARAEHLRILSRHAVFAILGNILASVTLVVGLWGAVRPGLLITWMSVVIVFNGVRWLAGRRFPKGVIGEEETRRWERRFLGTVAISGLLWGVAGGLFYIPSQPEHGLFLALLVIGMCAAGLASLSCHRIAYPVFLLPAVTPLMLHLMSDDNRAAQAVGYVIPFYFTLMYLLSRELYQTAHESILRRIESESQAMLDHLTGVANRRAFEEWLDREWHRAIRGKRTLSLVIADIDNFKLCNDTHGHAAGDRVLKAVAALMERRTRRGADLVARIGGEEFAIVLPDTDLRGAVAVAESIRVGLGKLTGRHPEIPTVTMSFGVSSLAPDDSLTTGLLFGGADTAVYQAKRKGRDRVEAMPIA
jgi:diguanylate cyclase (GGDEF)-like protein